MTKKYFPINKLIQMFFILYLQFLIGCHCTAEVLNWQILNLKYSSLIHNRSDVIVHAQHFSLTETLPEYSQNQITYYKNTPKIYLDRNNSSQKVI